MDVSLEIQELVLVDVPGAEAGGDSPGGTLRDRTALRQAITAELARLLQERGLPAALTQATHYPVLQGRELALPSTQTEPLGIAIAQAIYAALGGGSDR